MEQAVPLNFGAAMRYHALLPALMLTLTGAGQTEVMLLNGNMTVSAGTSIVISDTLAWQFASGSSLVNDGFIDLGHWGTLEELEGEPVTGIGTEQSLLDLNAAGPGAEPGGLGLTLDLPQADGMLSITRGHLPRVAGNGMEGVARWYFLEASALAGGSLPVSMQVDGSELNGLPPDELALYVSGSTDGPWEQVPTTIGPSNTLAGVLSGATLHLTAFDPDLITAASAAPPSIGYRVWPTVVQDVVHVGSLGSGSALIELEVLDATGRTVLRHVPPAGSSSASLSLQGMATGGYLVRVNNQASFRIVIP